MDENDVRTFDQFIHPSLLMGKDVAISHPRGASIFGHESDGLMRSMWRKFQY